MIPACLRFIDLATNRDFTENISMLIPEIRNRKP
jgi:hypothetical protein